MVDDPTKFLQFTGHIPVPVTTELLGERSFNILYQNRVFKELTIAVDAMCAGPYSFLQPGFLIIKLLGCKADQASKFLIRTPLS